MPCKYLTTEIEIVPGGTEVGGSIMPQKISKLACKLGRKPDLLFWASKCNKTQFNGPCWFWLEEHGSTEDVQFIKDI